MRKRYVQRDGELIEVSHDYRPVRDARTSHNIIPDIKPYVSMLTGKEVASRSVHREMLRAHGCIEVGNETKYLQTKPVTPPTGLKETLVAVANEKLRR